MEGHRGGDPRPASAGCRAPRGSRADWTAAGPGVTVPTFPGAGGSARWLGHEPLGLRSTGLPGFSAVGRRSAWLGHVPRRT